MVKKIWFITGTSRGFGRQWTEAALKRGDSVAATARDPEHLKPLAETYGDAIEETIEALQKVVRDGKARYLGFSEWTPEQIQAAIDIGVLTCLSPLSPNTRCCGRLLKPRYFRSAKRMASRRSCGHRSRKAF